MNDPRPQARTRDALDGRAPTDPALANPPPADPSLADAPPAPARKAPALDRITPAGRRQVASPDRLSSGADRLDVLLGGGFPERSAVLLHGPRFSGKEVLARAFMVRSLAADLPVIHLHTTFSADAAQRRMAEMEPHFEDLVARGLYHGIDTHTRLIGGPEDAPSAQYVDGPLDLNGIASAINRVQSQIQGEDHERHVVVVDSVSTLIAHSDPHAAFRFLQILLGRARAAGAVSLVLMDAGMHDGRDVEMFRHVMDGTIDTRIGEGKLQLQVRGLRTSSQLGWVDYRTLNDRFELTGSFAAGRIR